MVVVDVKGSAEALTPRTGAPRLHCAACGRRRSIEILDSDLDLCTDGLNVRFAMRGGCNAEMWPKRAGLLWERSTARNP